MALNVANMHLLRKGGCQPFGGAGTMSPRFSRDTLPRNVPNIGHRGLRNLRPTKTTTERNYESSSSEAPKIMRAIISGLVHFSMRNSEAPKNQIEKPGATRPRHCFPLRVMRSQRQSVGSCREPQTKSPPFGRISYLESKPFNTRCSASQATLIVGNKLVSFWFFKVVLLVLLVTCSTGKWMRCVRLVCGFRTYLESP